MRKILTWDLPISVTAAFTLSYAATFMFIVRLPPSEIFRTVLITCLVLSVIAAFRKILLRALPFLLILVPFIWYTKAYEPFADYIRGYIRWIWAVTPHPAFERLSVTLLSFAVTAPVFILIRCRSPALILMLAGGTLFFGLENAGFDYPRGLFWSFLAAILLQMAHSGQGPRRVSGSDGDSERADGPPSGEAKEEEAKKSQAAKGLRILAALPACLLVVLLSSLFIGPETDPFQVLREFTSDLSIFPAGRGRGAATDVTGVGSEMGGPFRPTGALMLTVESPSAAEGPYLRGGLGVVYDGRRWYGDGFEGLELGAAGLSGGETVPSWGVFPNITEHSYRITYASLRGTRLYLPGSTLLIGEPNAADGARTERDDLVWYTGDVIRLQSDPGPGFSYSVRARDSVFLFLLRPLNPAIPEESPSDFRQLPRDLPFRVSALAYGLAEYGDDYYNALAIERYLVDNFTYNPDMPQTPAGRDFVEHFLFEQREGYCTYFASAMVVLCRAAGLPARYVDGFAPSGVKENGVFQYTDDRAHSWAEVWIEGYGWMQFEPTPGYNRVEGPVYFPEPVREDRPTPPPPSPSTQEPLDLSAPTPPSVSGAAGGAGQDGWQIPWKTVRRIVLPPLTLFLIWGALRIRRKLFERMLRTFPYGQKEVKRIYKHLLWLVGHADVKPEPHETLNEFADRADEAWPTKIYVMRRVADVYGKSCYAAGPLTPEENETLRRYVEILERREHIHLGRTRYWIYSKVLSLLPAERDKDDGSFTFER